MEAENGIMFFQVEDEATRQGMKASLGCLQTVPPEGASPANSLTQASETNFGFLISGTVNE